MAPPSVTRERVRELTLLGRVAPDPRYHAQERGVRFEQLRTLLAFCNRVEPDRRPEHAHGHVAWCTNWGGDIYRIDFNLETRPDGEVILIVTGWKLEELSPMKKRIVDPDFGPIDLEGAVPAREEYERAARQIAEAARRFRAWPTGGVSDCPNCGKRAFVGRDDLSREVAKRDGVLVFRHLRGARCESCGVQALEGEDLVAVEQESGMGLVADYEAKVSNIGSGTVGTYWPKDVVRVMRLGPDRRLFIKILDADTALIKVDRRRTRPGRGESRRSRSGRRARSGGGATK